MELRKSCHPEVLRIELISHLRSSLLLRLTSSAMAAAMPISVPKCSSSGVRFASSASSTPTFSSLRPKVYPLNRLTACWKRLRQEHRLSGCHTARMLQIWAMSVRRVTLLMSPIRFNYICRLPRASLGKPDQYAFNTRCSREGSNVDEILKDSF